MKRYLFLLTAVLSACHVPAKSTPLAPRIGTDVNASFGRTWDATIDVLSDRNMSIKTLERASGVIEPADRRGHGENVPRIDERYADCGTGIGGPLHTWSANYTIVVRGDSARTRILVRAFYDHCDSRGVFESELEDQIRAKAERG